MEKKFKDLLNMDLQFFAEEDPEDGADPKNPKDDVDDPEDGGSEKTVSVGEMKRRIAKEQEKYEQQIEELENSMEDRIAEAVEKAQKEATLTGKELQEYKEKEAQRKLDEAQAEIERLKQENIKRDLKDEAIKTLSEKGMPVNEKVLNFVVRDTADDTLQAIDDLGEILREQKEENAQTKPPKTSGGLGKSGNEQKTTTQILDEAKITNF